MSATYRIEIRRDPHSVQLPWDAVVYRLSDDRQMTIVFGTSPDHALAAAREWVQDEEGTFESWQLKMFYVDDQGRDAEAPQSVKV